VAEHALDLPFGKQASSRLCLIFNLLLRSFAGKQHSVMPALGKYDMVEKREKGTSSRQEAGDDQWPPRIIGLLGT